MINTKLLSVSTLPWSSRGISEKAYQEAMDEYSLVVSCLVIFTSILIAAHKLGIA